MLTSIIQHSSSSKTVCKLLREKDSLRFTLIVNVDINAIKVPRERLESRRLLDALAVHRVAIYCRTIYRKPQVNESFRWTDSKDSSHRDESKSRPLFNTDRRALDYGCARQAPVNALSSPLPQSIAQQQQQSTRYTVGRMDGAGSFGAGRAGSAFDLLAFVKQPQTILRVLAWVRTAVFYELWLADYALPFMFRF